MSLRSRLFGLVWFRHPDPELLDPNLNTEASLPHLQVPTVARASVFVCEVNGKGEETVEETDTAQGAPSSKEDPSKEPPGKEQSEGSSKDGPPAAEDSSKEQSSSKENSFAKEGSVAADGSSVKEGSCNTQEASAQQEQPTKEESSAREDPSTKLASETQAPNQGGGVRSEDFLSSGLVRAVSGADSSCGYILPVLHKLFSLYALSD